MRTAFLIGIAAFLTACAGAAPLPQSQGEPQGRWQGYLQRNGLRQPMSLELTEASSIWDGRFSAGDNAVPLESVRVSGNNVHFESPTDGVFDGEADGDSLSGSVSGPVNGSFSLKRSAEWNPYPFGP